LLLASIWGASYMLIKIGLRDLSPEMVAFARIALAAAVLMPIAAAQGALRGLRGSLGVIVLVGAVQVAGPFLLIPLGEQHITSALAGILVATTPIFTALLAIRIDNEERSEGLRLVGVAIGLAGVVLLFGLDLTGSVAAVLGGLAVVLASLGYSVGGFIVKHRLSGARPLGSGRIRDDRERCAAPDPSDRHRAIRDPGIGADRGGCRPRHLWHGRRLRDLLPADRHRWPGPHHDRLVPRAWLRGPLRRDASRRDDLAGDAGRPRSDRRRLVARGLGHRSRSCA
jgi:EamA-like transporter family protein